MDDFQCPLCNSRNPEFVGVFQLASMLGKTEQFVRDKLRRGLVPHAVKVNDVWRVPTDKAKQYVLEQKGQA